MNLAYRGGAWQEEARYSRLASRVKELEASERRLTARIDAMERQARSDKAERDRELAKVRFDSEMSEMMGTFGVSTLVMLVLVWIALGG